MKVFDFSVFSVFYFGTGEVERVAEFAPSLGKKAIFEMNCVKDTLQLYKESL